LYRRIPLEFYGVIMSLYPTLEDLKVSELVEAQLKSQPNNSQYGPPAVQAQQLQSTISLYPSLSSYMGLDLATFAPSGNQLSTTTTTVVAPVSSFNIVGIKRAEVKPGLRKVTLCKDSKGKIGLTIKDINKGIFVACVCANSPAALTGLRFGDQILEINGQVVAGFSAEKTIKLLKKASPEKIEVVVRDRPFERIITLNKDSAGTLGFVFNSSGKITNIVKDSSAARNGLLIDHHLVEVDGQNVVALKEKEIQRIIEAAPRTVTITVMPSMLFEHMVKSIGIGELRKYMDHSVPDV
jgi:syntenin-1